MSSHPRDICPASSYLPSQQWLTLLTICSFWKHPSLGFKDKLFSWFPRILCRSTLLILTVRSWCPCPLLSLQSLSRWSHPHPQLQLSVENMDISISTLSLFSESLAHRTNFWLGISMWKSPRQLELSLSQISSPQHAWSFWCSLGEQHHCPPRCTSQKPKSHSWYLLTLHTLSAIYHQGVFLFPCQSFSTPSTALHLQLNALVQVHSTIGKAYCYSMDSPIFNLSLSSHLHRAPIGIFMK